MLKSATLAVAICDADCNPLQLLGFCGTTRLWNSSRVSRFSTEILPHLPICQARFQQVKHGSY